MATQATSFPTDKTLDRGREIIDIVTGLVKTLKNAPQSANGLIAAGKIQEVGQTYPLAQMAYRAALQADPKNAEAQVRSAIVYLKAGDFAKGLAAIKSFTDKNPNFRFNDISGNPRSAQTVLGDAYRQTGNLAAAKEAYAAAIKVVSNDDHSAAHLARLHLADNSIEDAISLSENFLGSTDVTALASTKRLLANDPNRLPALGGIVTNLAQIASDNA